MHLLTPKANSKITPVVHSVPILPHKKILLYVERDAFVFVSGKHILTIDFTNCVISRRVAYEPSTDANAYEIFGIIGIVKGFVGSYLAVISEIKLKGNINQKAIYTISKVAVLPLHYERSSSMMDRVLQQSKEENESENEADNDSNGTTPSRAVSPDPSFSISSPPSHLEVHPNASLPSSPRPPSYNMLVAKMKTAFVSRAKHLRTPSEHNSADAASEGGSTGEEDTDSFDEASASSPLTAIPKVGFSFFGNREENANDVSSKQEDEYMDRRIAREVTSIFSGELMFFSYEFDITTSLQSKHHQGPQVLEKPLWQQVDSRFWWNEHLLEEFVKLELHDWIIPIMQGSVEIHKCEIEDYIFDFILISRRSRERAGLRYQRRGLNEHGKAANFVETEQIIAFERGGISQYASFVQTRGSIPVFWSQSPFSLRPVPALERSEADNMAAFAKHFHQQIACYGRQIAVSLTELSGREAIVGGAYRKHVEELGEPNVRLIEFDFHAETKGMKYENIFKLVQKLEHEFKETSYFWISSENDAEYIYCEQTGVFRTNCMDCLDRTNVVQSAFARNVLNLQLMRLGISEFPDRGIGYYEQFEATFNNAWANNGDSISREYAGTSAMKGDFTRTGKRNIVGMVNDASTSIARLYQNTVKDYWRQATIDYIMGNHKLEIFKTIAMSSASLPEPGEDIRMAKVRANAIETSSDIVITDGEEKVDGWTLLEPTEANTRRGKAFEEKVVLLTHKAIYVCTFHYTLEKVVQFKRIGLETITKIEKGEYILSTADPSSTSPEQNYGLVIHYNTEGESMRINSGSIRNRKLSEFSLAHWRRSENLANNELLDESSDEEERGSAFFAFKAVRAPLGDSSAGSPASCRTQIQVIVEKIANAAALATGKEECILITDRPIISLEEATKSTGIISKVGNRLLKRPAWL